MSGKYIVDQFGNPISSENPFPVALAGVGLDGDKLKVKADIEGATIEATISGVVIENGSGTEIFTDSNPAAMKLMGRNVPDEIIKTATSSGLIGASTVQLGNDTNVGSTTVVPVPVAKYARRAITIYNTHDAAVNIKVLVKMVTTAGIADAVYESADINVAAGTTKWITIADLPILPNPMVGLIVKATRVTTPTTGTLKAEWGGGYN